MIPTYRQGRRNDLIELTKNDCPVPQNIDDVHDETQILMAYHDDKPIGYGVLSQTLHKQPLRPTQVFVHVAVMPRFRRNRIGSELLRMMLEQAGTFQASSIISGVEPGDQSSLAFAAGHGFSVDYHRYECLLDIRHFDSSSWQDHLDAVQAKGIRFVALAQCTNAEATIKQVYNLERALSQDVPEWSGYMQPFDEYAANLALISEGVILALTGDELVGMSVTTAAQDGTAYGSFLGVEKAYRGQGIACALKLLAVRWAQQRSLSHFRSHTNALSSTIVTLNRKLGCEIRPDTVYLVSDRPGRVTPAKVIAASPRQPDVARLIQALDTEMAELYPPESNHLLDVEALSAPDIRFFVATLDGKIVGCGALRLDASGYGEIKRMYVDPAGRGLKIGKAILQRLEQEARATELSCLRLETGTRQPEALALYRSAGFQEIPPFGDYKPDPLSLFMEKRLL